MKTHVLVVAGDKAFLSTVISAMAETDIYLRAVMKRLKEVRTHHICACGFSISSKETNAVLRAI